MNAMKYYSYFPGCSASDGGAKALNASSMAVAEILGVKLDELEDWNCCGSTPYKSVDDLASFCVSARNLALAEKRGLDLVTPCSACYIVMKWTNEALKDPEMKRKVSEALAAGGLKYNGTTRIRHILDVFVNDIGYDAIASHVTQGLGGLKVAPYYGCQILRPFIVFDHPENPQSLDRLVECLGATAVPFPLKARCCGGSLIISEERTALALVYKILDSAVKNGADCIITVCPLCQTNLDVYQGRVNKIYGTRFNIPILFFTQLIGLAYGVDSQTLGIDKCIVSADKVLNR